MANGTYLTVIPQLSRRHARASELQPMRRSGSCDDRVMIHLVSSCDDYVMMHLVSSCYDRVMIHLKSGFQLYRDSKTCNIIDFVSRYTRKCLFLCIVTPLIGHLAFLLIRRCSVAPISVPFCHSRHEDVPSPCF